MTALTLHLDAYWISPYVFTCFVALREKALAFEAHEVSLGDEEQLRPEYRDPTLTARVPALQHGDFWLTESTAIVEYLEETFPSSPRLLPESVKDRARARQVLGWLRSDLGALREERSTATMFFAHADKPLTKAGEAAAEKLLRVANALVPQDRTTLFASGFSIADSDLAFILHRLILNGHAVPDRLRAFAEAHWSRPSVQAFVQRERKPYRPY